MSRAKRTPWFPADVKPVRPGLYERKYPERQNISFPDRWDGEHWFIRFFDGQEIFMSGSKLKWRGLTEESK